MRQIPRSLAIAALALATLAAGCGLSPNAPLSTGSARVHARGDAQADAVVAAVSKTWNTVNTTSGHVTFWEKKDSETSQSGADFYWARPEKLRANITDADSAMKRNAKLVYLGDGKITVKVAFIKKTLAYDDPQVVSLRGFRIDQTGLNAVVGGLLDPKATLSYAGTTTLNGHTADLVAESGSTVLLPGLAKVVVAIDQQTHMPAQVQGYDAKEVVFKAGITNLAINPQLPGDIFNL